MRCGSCKALAALQAAADATVDFAQASAREVPGQRADDTARERAALEHEFHAGTPPRTGIAGRVEQMAPQVCCATTRRRQPEGVHERWVVDDRILRRADAAL